MIGVLIYSFISIAVLTIPVKITRYVLKWKDEKLIDDGNALFEDNTTVKQYKTKYATYPAIRTYYLAHSHANKLKAIADLPLLVFVHGIGGSLPPFAPLLGSFIHIAPTFGIELPGHGLSDFAPTSYEAYTFDALVDLWRTSIEDVCKRQGHNKIVLICHSLGCSIGAKLTKQLDVKGIIAICPKAPSNPSKMKKDLNVLSMSDFTLDTIRWSTKLEHEFSANIKLLFGRKTGPDIEQLQDRFLKVLSTPLYKRIMLGMGLRLTDAGGRGGLPGNEIWEDINIPLLLIAGEADTIAKVSEAASIMESARHGIHPDSLHQSSNTNEDKEKQSQSVRANDEIYGLQPLTQSTQSRNSTVVKFVTLPSPACHSLMLDHETYRTVAGLIEDFLSHHVSHQLELGWQLQKLTTSGKWDVKNLEKWKKVTAVSGPIDGGFFRALKTLREQDEDHTPSVFTRRWAKQIYAVIDISHDSPVYDTKTMGKGGIQYHKFPTVSKIPPTLVEVRNFIALVDRLRNEIDEAYLEKKPAIGVHCHYGYNRTGFFIVCYLVERHGYRVQDAIDEFAKHKPPGIRHDHFIDTLFVRYCVGLRRASTSR